MRFASELIPAVFERRDNRFRATVRLGRRRIAVHVANSGRNNELFVLGHRVWLLPRSGVHRKTKYDLALVEYAGVLVSVDARLPSPLFAEALEERRLLGFRAYTACQSEVNVDDSRLDFRLDGRHRTCWVEVKSVTLVEGETAYFPDAPTSRGVRHVRLLQRLHAPPAVRSAVVFIVQRPDAVELRPHPTADPHFTAALEDARRAGVRLRAYACQVSTREVRLADEIPVRLPRGSLSLR